VRMTGNRIGAAAPSDTDANELPKLTVVEEAPLIRYMASVRPSSGAESK
jgi:hypothetical protein